MWAGRCHDGNRHRAANSTAVGGGLGDDDEDNYKIMQECAKPVQAAAKRYFWYMVEGDGGGRRKGRMGELGERCACAINVCAVRLRGG